MTTDLPGALKGTSNCSMVFGGSITGLWLLTGFLCFWGPNDHPFLEVAAGRPGRTWTVFLILRAGLPICNTMAI